MNPRLLSGLTGSPLLRGGGIAGASGLVLDNITNAANVTGVWSLRKLKSAYAGNCLRIRRSSDNTEQDFGFSADVVDAAGIASFVGGGAGYAVTWYDQGGNGFDATQSTAGSQPLFVASGIGGKPSLQFDGNDSLLTASIPYSSLFSAQQATIFSVIRQDGTNNLNSVMGFDVSGKLWVLATYADTLYFDFGADRVSAAQPSGWDDSDRVLELFRTTGNTQAIYENGNSLVSATKSGAMSGTDTFKIGISPFGGDRFKGYIAEIITSSVDIGSTDRATIRANQGSYFGITVV